jgi:FkbM family methyltransferase
MMAAAKVIETPEFTVIARRIAGWNPSVILDVGANVGQSAVAFAKAYPQAMVHSFEPFPASYRKLLANTRGYDNIMAHQIGLGAEPALVQMSDGAVSTQNRILADAQGDDGIEVAIHQGAAVLDRLGLAQVSYLKIDTEGHDLEVLKGFAPALNRIDFIQVEAGMNRYNQTHVPFAQLCDFMQEHGFLLFYIFEQILEFKKGGRPVLRRANPLFINPRLVDLEGIA